MKPAFTCIIFLTAAATAYSQGGGGISINNCDPANLPRRQISYAPGGPQTPGNIDGSGSNPQNGFDFGGIHARAAMYGGPLGCSADQMVLLAPPVDFRSGTGAGCVDCASQCSRSVPGVAPGTSASIQMRAWDAGVSGVDTYESAAALAVGRGVYLGTSPIANVQVGDVGSPGMPSYYAFSSFSIYWSAAAAPPIITSQLQGGTGCQGSDVTLSATVSGTPPLTYLWFFNGTNIYSGTNPTLTITNINVSNAGSYWFVVTNVAGAATSEVALLIVRMPPAITAQPQSQMAPIGTNAAFSVAADGTPPLSYQWWFADTALTGQTNSTLSLTNIQTNHVGSYWVVVGNACGSVMSQPALLSITPELEIFMVPGVLIKGVPGTSYLLEFVIEAGPTNVWTALATITLTNAQQFYFDTSAIGKPSRCYRALQSP